jgi:hypothetical protein
MAYPNGSGQDNEAKDLKVRDVLKRYFIGARATQIKPSESMSTSGRTRLPMKVITGLIVPW